VQGAEVIVWDSFKARHYTRARAFDRIFGLIAENLRLFTTILNREQRLPGVGKTQSLDLLTDSLQWLTGLWINDLPHQFREVASSFQVARGEQFGQDGYLPIDQENGRLMFIRDGYFQCLPSCL
jgi:hypothetical protein